MEDGLKSLQADFILGLNKLIRKSEASGMRGGSAVPDLPPWHYMSCTSDIAGPNDVSKKELHSVTAPTTSGFQHDIRKKVTSHEVFVARALRQKELKEQEDKKSTKLQQACTDEMARNMNEVTYKAAMSVVKLPEQIVKVFEILQPKAEEQEKSELYTHVELSEVALIAEAVADNAREARSRAWREVKEARRLREEAAHAALCSRTLPVDKKKRQDDYDFDPSKAFQTSTLEVTIIEGSDFPQQEAEVVTRGISGKPQTKMKKLPPFSYAVITTITKGRASSGAESAYFRTASPPRTHNPKWEESFELSFISMLLDVTDVTIEVYFGREQREQNHTPSYNRGFMVDTDEMIGHATIPLRDFLTQIQAKEYPYGKVEPAHLVGSIRHQTFQLVCEDDEGVVGKGKPPSITISAQLLGEWPNTQRGPRALTTLKLPTREPAPDPVPTRFLKPPTTMHG